MRIAFGEPLYLKDAGKCPVCLKFLTGAAPTTNNREEPVWSPKVGDYSICMYCSTILRFEFNSQYKEADREDLLELQKNQPETFELLSKMVVAAQQMVAERRRKQKGKHRSH